MKNSNAKIYATFSVLFFVIASFTVALWSSSADRIEYLQVELNKTHTDNVMFRSLTNAIPGGLVSVTQTDGHIQYANNAFTTITGYERSELIGTELESLKIMEEIAVYGELLRDGDNHENNLGRGWVKSVSDVLSQDGMKVRRNVMIYAYYEDGVRKWWLFLSPQLAE